VIELQPSSGLLVCLLFAAGWLFVLNILAFIGGWRSLAAVYAATGPPQGESFSFRSASLDPVNYASCLRFVAGPAGLYIAVLFPFRPGHRPLFVPWSDVSASPRRGWLFRYIDLRFARQPGVTLQIRRGLAEHLLAAGGHAVRVQEAA